MSPPKPLHTVPEVLLQHPLRLAAQLQFEVFEYRLKNEYNAAIRMDRLDMSVVRWIGEGVDLEKVKDAIDSRQMLVFDHFERPLLLFANQFTLNYFQEKHENIKLIEALDVVNKY